MRTELLKLERDLQIGRQIQQSFLPDTLPQVEGWELAACFRPAREVAGDFYDAFPLTNNRRLGLVIADVCDKGVGAALFMALFRTLMRAFAQQHQSLGWTDVLASGDNSSGDFGAFAAMGARRRGAPAIGAGALKNAVLQTNNYIVQNHGLTGMFATLFFGVLDPATGAMAYVNCGHNPPLILGNGVQKARLEGTGPALGIIPDVEFEIRQAQLDPGDFLLLYTDGVPEARDVRGEFYTEPRLVQLAARGAPTAGGLLDRIEESVMTHIGDAEQYDDITMLAARRQVSPPQ